MFSRTHKTRCSNEKSRYCNDFWLKGIFSIVISYHGQTMNDKVIEKVQRSGSCVASIDHPSQTLRPLGIFFPAVPILGIAVAPNEVHHWAHSGENAVDFDAWSEVERRYANQNLFPFCINCQCTCMKKALFRMKKLNKSKVAVVAQR